jgi:hypothetical protein
MGALTILPDSLADETARLAWEFNREIETNPEITVDQLRAMSRKLEDIAERAA